MKLARSDSPEVARCIASARLRANRYLSIALIGLLPSLVILLVSLVVGFLVSVQGAAWLCVPAFLAWNSWVLWRARSPHLSWIIGVHDERVCIRLFVGFGRAWRSLNLPDVIILEASEIASMSIRTVEVLVYGPKPRIVEWLMIEPTQAAAENLSDQIPSFLADNRSPDFWTPYLGERLHWANDDRRFAIGWKMCRPALRVFLRQVARECPSIVVGPEESSELDLNGIWHGVRGGPNPEQRLMLVEVRRLGFGPDCTKLLNRYRGMPYREIGAFWAEIQREEAATRQ